SSSSQVNRGGKGKSRVPGLNVSIIGAGRIGTALGVALSRAGHSIEVVSAKHALSARRLARMISRTTIGVSTVELLKPPASPLKSLAQSSLVLIAIPDDYIAMTANNLANALASIAATAKPHKRNRPVVLHTSGALSSRVLDPLVRLGYSTGSL